MVEATSRLIEQRDRGRGLRSYRLALRTIAGCAELLRGDGARAASLLAAALQENFFARSASTVAMLRADALLMSRDSTRARAIYQRIASHAVPDTDFEAWPPLGVMATRRLERLGKGARVVGGTTR